MHIGIVGSGGLGGYFGARLAAGGSDVHFLARGSHLAARVPAKLLDDRAALLLEPGACLHRKSAAYSDQPDEPDPLLDQAANWPENSDAGHGPQLPHLVGKIRFEFDALLECNRLWQNPIFISAARNSSDD